MMKQLTIFLLLCVTVAGFSSEGVVVVLNGPSAVGKSSLQKALQEECDLFFVRIGIDTLFDAMIENPDLSEYEMTGRIDQYTKRGEYIRGVERTVDEEGYPIAPLKVGPAGHRIICGMHKAIAAYAAAGNNVVVDYISYDPAWADDLRVALEGYKVIWVGLNAPLEIVEEREHLRGTSPVGHARSHYDTVHKNMTYDIEIDTSLVTPKEGASKLIFLLNKFL